MGRVGVMDLNLGTPTPLFSTPPSPPLPPPTPERSSENEGVGKEKAIDREFADVSKLPVGEAIEVKIKLELATDRQTDRLR